MDRVGSDSFPPSWSPALPESLRHAIRLRAQFEADLCNLANRMGLTTLQEIQHLQETIEQFTLCSALTHAEAVLLLRRALYPDDPQMRDHVRALRATAPHPPLPQPTATPLPTGQLVCLPDGHRKWAWTQQETHECCKTPSDLP